MHKPAEEYYLHDHGDGNGWQVMSKGPGKHGLCITGGVYNHDGVIELVIEKYMHGAFSSMDTEHYMLTPEEAYDMGKALLARAEEGEAIACRARQNKREAVSSK
jgi:hypothetical protein